MKNILLITADQWRAECLSVLGHRVQTPHLDALAEDSVLFENHFVQVPTCGASRFALLTGRSPMASGVTSNNAALYQGTSRIRDESLPGA